MAEPRKTVIIGSGPAGYTAAVYTARAELKPLVLSGEKPGGQLVKTTLVENWPGTERGVMGPDLMVEMRKQAEKFGAEIVDKKVTKVDFSQRPFKIWAGEEEVEAESVIVATGAESVMLGVPGEKELLGRGVATCAVCDAPFYRDKVTLVIGGGDAAVEDALALSKYAKEVYLAHRRDELRASKIMARRLKEKSQVKILWNRELQAVIGKEKVEKVKLKNNQTGEEEEMMTDGVFLAIGHKPATEIFKGQLELDDKGYILTRQGWEKRGLELAKNSLDENGLVRFPTMTSVEGVMAAGDVVDFNYKQAITAAGMGCMAALDAERWLEEREK